MDGTVVVVEGDERGPLRDFLVTNLSRQLGIPAADITDETQLGSAYEIMCMLVVTRTMRPMAANYYMTLGQLVKEAEED